MKVLVVYRGAVEISVEAVGGTQGPAVRLLASGAPNAWDSYAMPAGCWRSYRNRGDTEAVLLVMTAGDGRKTVSWDQDVIAAAGALDQGR